MLIRLLFFEKPHIFSSVGEPLHQGRNMVYPGPTDPYFLAVILIPEPHFPQILIPEPC